MLIAVTIWWLFFFTSLGLCLGSFLNVVIHRLPAGLSINSPTWSFCPHCTNRIAWYDNVPVIGYLRLGARCRNCWSPISPRYPIVEIMTALTILVLFDTFFIAQARDGLLHVPELSWRIGEDWPIFVAHVILFASLLAMSGIDMECYWVDIRFTHFAALSGLVLHTIWTPLHSRQWPRPFDATAFAGVAAMVGFGGALLIMNALRGEARDEAAESEAEPAESNDESSDDEGGCRWTSPVRSLSLPLAVLLFVLVASAGAAIGTERTVPMGVRFGVPLVFLVLIVLRGASHSRPSDVEIMEAIESESVGTRRRTLGELGLLLPGIVLGAAAVWSVLTQPVVAETVERALNWRPTGGSWRPLWGFSTAVSGYVLGAGIGWCVRILANLAFGKEAYGTGDIHMMAAAGAVTGWQVVLMGFMLACFLAMAAWLVLLPFKRSRAIPLGPWLSLGFLTAVVFYQTLVSTPVVQNLVTLAGLLFFENSQIASFE